MYSSNNGDDWTLQRRPGGIKKESMLLSVSFPTPTHGYILGYGGLLLKTIDGGESWEDISSDNINNYYNGRIYFIDDDTGFLTGWGGYILRTADGGNSWVIVDSPTPAGLNCVRFFNENKGLVFGDAGVIFKLDTVYFANINENDNPAGMYLIAVKCGREKFVKKIIRTGY